MMRCPYLLSSLSLTLVSFPYEGGKVVIRLGDCLISWLDSSKDTHDIDFRGGKGGGDELVFLGDSVFCVIFLGLCESCSMKFCHVFFLIKGLFFFKSFAAASVLENFVKLQTC